MHLFFRCTCLRDELVGSGGALYGAKRDLKEPQAGSVCHFVHLLARRACISGLTCLPSEVVLRLLLLAKKRGAIALRPTSSTPSFSYDDTRATMTAIEK